MFVYSMLSSLAPQIPKEFSITVALPRKTIPEFQTEFGDVFHILPLPNIPDPLLDFFYFSAIAIFNKFNLVHFTGNTGLVIGRKKCRVLLTIHDVSYMKSGLVVPWARNIKQIIGRIYRRFTVPIYVKSANQIVTVSKFAAIDLKLELDLPEMPDFIYHGINQSHGSKLSLMTHLEIVKNNYLVIGGSDPQKNIRTVVNAFSVLFNEKALSAPQVVIIGLTAKEFEKTKSGINISPNIHFLGFLNNIEVVTAINFAKCVIVPSYYESFGFPIIEALSNKVAVISSDRGALREIGGRAPIFFNPDNLDSLLNAVYSFEGLPDRELEIKNWLEESLPIFDWNKCVASYLRIYENLILS